MCIAIKYSIRYPSSYLFKSISLILLGHFFKSQLTTYIDNDTANIFCIMYDNVHVSETSRFNNISQWWTILWFTGDCQTVVWLS